MTQEYKDKLNSLREEIFHTISPLINGDVHLTNLPYHANLGDALIWRGTEDFLASTGHKILSHSSFLSCCFPNAKPGDVIVLNGGGSFGDVWQVIMDFFLKVAERYPNNRIILLSQSAWYDDPSRIETDAAALAKHPDFHLVARDEFTYNLFKTHFKANPSYLAPDMAFAINPKRLEKWQDANSGDGTLYLRRVDKEWNEATAIDIPNAMVSDWPTLTSPQFLEKCYFIALNRTMYSIGHSSLLDITYWLALNLSAKQFILNRFLRRGAEFILPFNRIITTRLHVLILATLLGKNVEYIDNTTGKLSAYANTWLNSFGNITPFKS